MLGQKSFDNMSEPVSIENGKLYISDYEVIPCGFKPCRGLNKYKDIVGFRSKERQMDLVKG